MQILLVCVPEELGSVKELINCSKFFFLDVVDFLNVPLNFPPGLCRKETVWNKTLYVVFWLQPD